MIIFFVGVLIVLGGLSIYLFYQIKQMNFTVRKIYPSAVSKSNLSEKLALDPEKNPEFSLTLTSEELTSVLSPGIKTLALEIKESQANISRGGVLVSGKLVKPLKSDIQIETQPKVKDGKIRFETQKITAGKLILPKFFYEEFSSTLNVTFDQNFSKLYENYQVTEIKLNQDEMIISGRLK